MTTPLNILSNRKAIINTGELYGGGGGGGGGLMLFLSVRFCPFSENRVPNGQKRTKIVTFYLNCLHNL